MKNRNLIHIYVPFPTSNHCNYLHMLRATLSSVTVFASTVVTNLENSEKKSLLHLSMFLLFPNSFFLIFQGSVFYNFVSI